MGKAYSWLRALRGVGGYGTGKHVSAEDARQAVGEAEVIVSAVEGEMKKQ